MCTKIELPETLRYIGSRAFSGVQMESVVIPKSVQNIGVGAFYGAKRITVYDTISPDAVRASSCEDSPNGVPNSSIGWLGIDFNGTVFAIWNASYSDFEVIVRSAKTDEVLYRVYMPIRSFAGPSGSLGNVKGWLAATLVSSWGKHASFAFERLDDMFDELPNQYAKLKTAINRLAYPVDLEPGMREVYEEYLRRNAKRAIAAMAEDDEVDELRAIASVLVTKANRKKLADACTEAPHMREYLLAYNEFDEAPSQHVQAGGAWAHRGTGRWHPLSSRAPDPPMSPLFLSSSSKLPIWTVCHYPAPGKKPKIEGIADLEARYPWLVTKGTLPPEAGEERRQLAYFINKSAVCPADSFEGEGQ